MHAACRGGLIVKDEIKDIKQSVSKISIDVDSKTKEVRSEVERRNIGWNTGKGGSSKQEVAVYPKKFSGTHGEDFWLFKKEMETALKKNRIPLDSQAAKLKDFLVSPALDVVPRSQTDIAVCWESLEACYGSVEAIFCHKMGELRSLPTLTPLLNHH